MLIHVFISNIYYQGSNAVEESQCCKRNKELCRRGEVAHKIDVSPSTTTATRIWCTKLNSIQPGKDKIYYIVIVYYAEETSYSHASQHHCFLQHASCLRL